MKNMDCPAHFIQRETKDNGEGKEKEKEEKNTNLIAWVASHQALLFNVINSTYGFPQVQCSAG